MAILSYFTSGVPAKKWFKDLMHEISEDNVSNGAAALAYFFFFAIFPALIFLLSLIPYLPIPNLHQAVMDFLRQAMPTQVANQIEGVIAEVTLNKKPSLLSIGAVVTVWSASAGIYAIMQQLNITYDVKETRPFWKARGESILLTLLFGILIAVAFSLIVFGGVLQNFLSSYLDWGTPLLVFFALFRWVVIALLLLASFAVLYYFGPDVEQKFRFISPGAVIGTIVIAIAAMAFRVYVDNFSNYAATYGSLGAVIILMLWLYITGNVILLGSEVNALSEHYSPEGKTKGEHEIPPKNVRGLKKWRWGSALSGGGGGSRKPLPPMREPAVGSRPSLVGQYADVVLATVALVLAATKGTRGSRATKGGLFG